jgi:hypothetical protein
MYIRLVYTFCIYALHMRSVYTLGDTNGRMNGRIGRAVEAWRNILRDPERKSARGGRPAAAHAGITIRASRDMRGR